MGRNKHVTLNVCCKTMRGDNLKGHMKKHEIKQQLRDEAESSRSDAFGEMKHIDKDENPRHGACGQMENAYEAGTNRNVTSSVKCKNIN